MKRREFIALIGGATAWPLAARTQQLRTRPLLGWLGGSTPEMGRLNLNYFLQGLREHGYEDRKSIDIAYRWANGDSSRLPALAKELVALGPDLILSASGPGNVALMQSTASIAIVGALTVDPVKLGLAVSHNRPGRNFTGVLVTLDGLPGKQTEFLLQLLPRTTAMGVLINPDSPTNPFVLRDINSALQGKPIRITQAIASKPTDLPAAFEAFKHDGVGGVVIPSDNFFFSSVAQIVSLAETMRLPVVYDRREHVERGGLISYGVAIPQNFRRAADFVDRILKGSKPSDLPIEFPTKLELAINIKTAKSLGLDIPPTLLAIADEVIE
jgi:putative ABC transport system substrate-binding protein